MSLHAWLARLAPAKDGGRSLRERIDSARLSVVKAGKHAGAAAHKVAVQGMGRARLTGAKLARHIIAVQKAAGATPKMMRESARSIANRPMTRPSDRAWQAAYTAEAQRQCVLPWPKPEPAAAMAGPAPAASRPSWPNITPSGIDREAT